MTLHEPAPLHTSLLRIAGVDALRFAHAQFTSHVSSLAVGAWQWSAWLDARGRVQQLFHLLRIDEHTLLLALRGGDAGAMASQLQRFVFRDKVTLEALPSRSLQAGAALPAGSVQSVDDALHLGFGDRRLCLLPTEASHDTTWRRQAIANGEPWLPDAVIGTLLPPALSLRRLGALSLDKGCFPGQEIAARLHYRGGHKQVLLHVQLAAPCVPGDRVSLDAGAPEASDDASLRVLDCIGRDALVLAHERTQMRLESEAATHDDAPHIVRAFGA
ncbi:YgfZ/GcvT domain-containing protein [Oleiagrimonas soli]|uniref:Aminomethyltransferase folate-binding domain-containing protein n=1 Tax=Oleiagrimonas soli TaxID=1543381 RepID=A0A841KCV1_9GAMM|nr:folate-binding protein YgfZ [Oleiagrimonas soli]MBB6183433.1 hypothetical protein [Oleiagrimonas soli]